VKHEQNDRTKSGILEITSRILTIYSRKLFAYKRFNTASALMLLELMNLFASGEKQLPFAIRK